MRPNDGRARCCCSLILLEGIWSYRFVPFANYARSRCFKDFYRCELWELRRNGLAQPPRQILSGRLKIKIVIQERVVELLDDRANRSRNVGVVHHPLHALVQFAFAMDAHLVAMTVQIPALMTGWNLGQLMCRFKSEVLPEFECVVESLLSVHNSFGCLADS